MKPHIEVNELLRAVHHDMLNRLQVMQMNLDLGRTDQVRRLIEDYSLRCQHFFQLNNAGFHQMNNWLETVHIHHPEIKVTYEVEGAHKATPDQDSELVQMFDDFLHQMKERFTDYHDQLIHVTFEMKQPLHVHVHFVGNWTVLQDISYDQDTLFEIQIVEYTKTSLKLEIVERAR
ncbi:Spo0B domain-containing protein [Chryseomicrobium palamuruense]|uniref:Spo0B domain-containing protein n=1 Tax=Chryseomicrobium palamuruense TaxID=682973 RepID=A0ABV8UXJ5_9BACL